MSFLGIAVNYCMRVNMSVAIVAMVKPGKFKTIFPISVYEKTLNGMYFLLKISIISYYILR